jgi:hypothetical protein
MVEDNLSRLEVSNGQPIIRTTYKSGLEITLEPWGNFHYDVFENGEMVGIIDASELAEFVKLKHE